MFDFNIQKPTWIQVRYSANPQDIESILQESDQAYLRKVESYLAFHVRPDEHENLIREFMQQLQEDKNRKYLLKLVVQQYLRNPKPVVITFDPGCDITHLLQAFGTKQ